MCSTTRLVHVVTPLLLLAAVLVSTNGPWFRGGPNIYMCVHCLTLTFPSRAITQARRVPIAWPRLLYVFRSRSRVDERSVVLWRYA